MDRTSFAGPDTIGFLLAKAAQRFNERLAAGFAVRGYADIRPSYGSVLVPLFARDGLRPIELAAASRLSKQAITGLVKQCEEAGLVARVRDDTDGRAFIVRLTARGRAARSAAEQLLAELDEELTRSIGDRDRAALTRALRGVMEL